MTDLNKLASMLMELDDQMASCMKCGMCQAVCPVFSETMLEADVTRGKITLLEQLSREMIDDPDQVNEKLNRCLLCGSCAANCPSGVKILDIFMKARVITTEYKGLSQAKKIVFKGLLKHPKLFNLVSDLGAYFQGPFTKTENKITNTASCKMLSPLLGERHLSVLSKKPFRKSYQGFNSEPGKSKIKIAFFYGCLVDKLFPQIGHAAMEVFQHHEVGVFIPENQACCGIPPLASGDSHTFRDLIKKNVSEFEKEDFDYILTPCATCTATIKETWPSMMDKKDKEFLEKVETLSSKTMDISEFLVDKLGVEVQENKADTKKITYHDPCHLSKSLGVSSQPRKLINSGSGYELKEMIQPDRCCGCGGSFNLFHYDISKKIGEKKAENIIETNADIAATSCPACMMQIKDMLSQNGSDIDVRHVIEIYADSLKNN